MDIIITNNIQQDKISIDFNFQDGSLSFPVVEINTSADIDFNLLVIKLAELIELNKKLDFNFVDTDSLVDNNTKIGLIKTTLTEIYEEFNKRISTAAVEADQTEDTTFQTDTKVE